MAGKRMNKTSKQLLEAGRLVDQKQFTQAELIYRELLKKERNLTPALMGLAIVLNQTKRAAEALPLLERIANRWAKGKENPTPTAQAALEAQLGLAFEQTGDTARAVTHYQKAVAFKPSAELQQRIALLTSKAQQSHTDTIVQTLLEQAEALQKKGDLLEAEKHARAAHQLAPGHHPVLYRLGWILWLKGEQEQALDCLQEAAVLAPENPIYVNDLALFYHQRKQYEKAITFYQRAITLQPNFIPTLVNLGAAYKQLGKFDLAAQTFTKALQINPNQPEVHNNLGNLFRQMGRLTEAKACYQRALKLRPNYPEALRNLKELTQLKT